MNVTKQPIVFETEEVSNPHKVTKNKYISKLSSVRRFDHEIHLLISSSATFLFT